MKKSEIIILENFNLEALNRTRTIRIYLPSNYDGIKRFPVLYMHDGQNLFDDKTAGYGVSWHIKDTLDDMILNHLTNGLIVVGIDNGTINRLEEYYPWERREIKELFHLDDSIPTGGKGFLYLESIVKSVKPYIDSHYLTLKEPYNTAISGSSMGGIISLVAGILYPDVFGKVAALSSAFYYGGKPFMDWLKIQEKYPTKVYMDTGTKESSDDLNSEFPSLYMQTNQQVYEFLKTMLDEKHLTFVIDPDAIHHESAWAKRFKPMILWLFNDN